MKRFKIGDIVRPTEEHVSGDPRVKNLVGIVTALRTREFCLKNKKQYYPSMCGWGVIPEYNDVIESTKHNTSNPYWWELAPEHHFNKLLDTYYGLE